MQPNESVQFFLRFLKEQHEIFKSRISNLIAILVEDDKENKKNAAQATLEAAQTMKSNLSDQDSPGWLLEAIKAIKFFLKNINNSGINNSLMLKLIPIYNQINSHQWKFDDPQKILAFDFDSIYNQCKKESKLDSLFDGIISLLQKLIDGNEIDSMKMRSNLEKLIATLKNHKLHHIYHCVVCGKFHKI